MTVTVPTSGSAREQLRHKETTELSDKARLGVAAHSTSPADCRDLALMLGLIEVDPSGSLVKANPWEIDILDSRPGPLKE
jgi:hypothetical protein